MSDDRHGRIVRLLETMNDHLPQPSRRTHTRSGFVNVQWPRSCPDCLANGRTMVACETCRGTGHILGTQLAAVAVPDGLDDDGATHDPYTVTLSRPYGIDGSRHDRTYDRDAEIDRLSSQTREPFKTSQDELAHANQTPYGWETMRRRMYAAYDYRPLDLALEQLRGRDPAASHLLLAVYTHRLIDMSATVEAVCGRGLRFIDPRMPDPIRAPGTQHPAAARQHLRSSA